MVSQSMTNEDVYSYVLLCARQGAGSYSGGQYQIDCPNPVHVDARTMYIEPRRHLYICFSCGLRGTLREAVLSDPSRWLPVRRACEGVHGVTNTTRLEDLQGMVPITQEHPAIFRSFRTEAYSYLIGRGMTPAQIDDYKVSLMPSNTRVWFPVWDDHKRVTFRMGRTVLDGASGPKTWEDSVLEDKPLFGSHVHEPNGLAVLTEGVFDHFATPDSYGMLGSYITKSQSLQLREWQRAGKIDRTFIIMDPDAKDKAKRAARQLRRFDVTAAAVSLEDTKSDPAELGGEVMLSIVRQLRMIRLRAVRSEPFLSAFVSRRRSG